VEFDGSFGEAQFQYQGAPQEVTRHISERHRIEIMNAMSVQMRPLLLARLGGPGDTFNRQYILVVAWQSATPGDDGAWMKRCYYGVTVQPVKGDGTAASNAHGQSGGPAMHQVIRLSAQRLVQSAGTGGADLGVSNFGEVRYISATENLSLYAYNADGASFTPTHPALIAGRAEIVQDEGDVDITIGGTLALRATLSGGLLVHAAMDGQTFADTVPRLEFWMSGTRRATLTQAGMLVANSFNDNPTAPDDSTALRIQDSGGNWLFTLGASVTCPEYSDALP
jgi:hypothetical protein